MKYTFFLMLLLIWVISTNAQEHPSDQHNLEKIQKFANTNIDSLLYYSKKSQASSDACTQKTGVLGEASAYYHQGNFEKSEKISLQIIQELSNTNTPCAIRQLLTAYNRLFWIKKNQGEYNEAFKYLLLKQNTIDDISTKDEYYHLHRLSANMNMASLKEILGLYTEALSILKETNIELNELYTTNFSKYSFLKIIHANNLNTIGNTYFNLGKDSISSLIDSAAVYYRRAYDVALTFNPKHENTEQFYLMKKVKLYLQKEKYQNALDVLTSIQKQGINPSVLKSFQLYKALVYFNQKKTEAALTHANRFLKNYNNTPNSKEQRIVIYDILANLYNTKTNTDSAYYYSNLGLEELARTSLNKDKINKTYYQYRFSAIKNRNETVIRSERTTYQTRILAISGVATVFILFVLYKSKTTKKEALQKLRASIDEREKSISPPKKDYKIEKKVAEDILQKLEKLEQTEEFLAHDFTIKVLAKKLKTNTSYLSYILNNSKKQTFKQYITKLRIDYLLQKLQTNKQYQNYTIEYLANEIGYTNASAFTRAFKKEVGMTPSMYLKSINT